MSTYYKAVRPEGTSFHDPSFRWLPESGPVEGHTVTHPTASVVGEEASHYLSVSVSPTDCTGMGWPCRLLGVEPIEGHEVTAPAPDGLPSKRAAVAWRVIRELPASGVFGPQGEHVAALIERASHLTGDEARKLNAAWDAARGAARGAAWDAARGAARGAAWDAARGAAWDAAWGAARDAGWDAARDAGWDAAWGAARDAAAALMVRDLISTAHYDTLTRPWASVIGKAHPDD